jgi:hypothetical protein
VIGLVGQIHENALNRDQALGMNEIEMEKKGKLEHSY